MHQYSIDKKTRERVIYVLVILSVAFSQALKSLFAGQISCLTNAVNSSEALSGFASTIKMTELIPNLIGVPVLYWLLSLVFDKCLWRLKPLNRILAVPDLNGIWEGTLCSSHENQSIHMSLEIRQTWKKIECKAFFDKSSSSSNVAALYSEVSGGPILYFGFHNQSKDISTGTQSYDGYNILRIKTDSMSGEYFNNRPSSKKSEKGGNLGTIELTLNKSR